MLQPRHPGVHFLKIIELVTKHVNNENTGKPRVLAINVYLHSLAALAANKRQSEFCENLMYHESDPG